MYRNPIDNACLDGFSSACAGAGALDGPDLPARETLPARMDIVFIENFIGQTVIGIDSSEQDVAQPVRMNLAIGVPVLRACSTDRIEDTVNYAAVRGALHALLASHGVRLLEALAEAVARLLIVEFGAHWVRVAIAKPDKFEDVAAVGVVIERRRGKVGGAISGYAGLGEGLFPN
ncbi:dihydroneopterin aldolase [Paraburkholderia unamae]|uniref:dihydroneopterin aldolase n=1 Tax=Paraburkholderia unamae TaxID=219649 RepID=A0ABX5KF99_9BURK|nr:dihydroneopterin aldolase [Paraburkholderia unamae]PVX77049.1 dihydroneopterin aldolase [Paraburkholderia unamae]RAR47700.1 dihydroneopterin aldolase [Paraburkholderia unamae]CAG9261568.1 Dihydroneopterin aldolase [Paraburkholderia unamae]